MERSKDVQVDGEEGPKRPVFVTHFPLYQTAMTDLPLILNKKRATIGAINDGQTITVSGAADECMKKMFIEFLCQGLVLTKENKANSVFSDLHSRSYSLRSTTVCLVAKRDQTAS